MPKLEITNMVMVQDKTTGKVIAQDRIKSWCGISFPGGHAENGESICQFFLKTSIQRRAARGIQLLTTTLTLL